MPTVPQKGEEFVEGPSALMALGDVFRENQGTALGAAIGHAGASAVVNTLAETGKPFLEMYNARSMGQFFAGAGPAMLAMAAPIKFSAASKEITLGSKAEDWLKTFETHPKTAKSLENIQKALQEEPSSSILDVAAGHQRDYGTKVFKSEDLEKIWPLYREAGSIPKKAGEQGYTEVAFHGTRTPTEFDKFRLPDNELGVHFGSPRAAQEIQGNVVTKGESPRVYPTVLQVNNPLRLKDSGTWSTHKMVEQLKYKEGFDPNEVTQAADNGIQGLRDLIRSKGYDSVVYKNKVEDPGHDSYILFNESSDSPGYITGVRSPFAKFDPAKMGSADLAAGLAGATAVHWYLKGAGDE